MKRVRWFQEQGRTIAPRLRDVRVWVKHHVRAEHVGRATVEGCTRFQFPA